MRPLHLVSTVLPSSTRSFSRRNSFDPPPNRNMSYALSYGFIALGALTPTKICSFTPTLPLVLLKELCASALPLPDPTPGTSPSDEAVVPEGPWRKRPVKTAPFLHWNNYVPKKEANFNYTGKEGAFLNSSPQRDAPQKDCSNLLEGLQQQSHWGRNMPRGKMLQLVSTD